MGLRDLFAFGDNVAKRTVHSHQSRYHINSALFGSLQLILSVPDHITSILSFSTV